ncbi:MAG: hypothetical protein A3F67_11260 [Verrucomicrobia bacterium RIFCSPHIGHO2_12_FULL_41_10]|nr:MAG: hypothetical protein A3F67_11260 [Verrucomicrobia bacterium RIFCSPHIGHO2_12_FULL_41_10]
MKKFFPLFLILLSPGFLFAETNTNTPVEMDDSYSYIGIRYGLKKNNPSRDVDQEAEKIHRYHIGTAANPVTAEEYCEFLNDKATHDSYWLSRYYDDSFMETTSLWSFYPFSDWGASDALIIRIPNNDCYEYRVNLDMEEMIIDSVQSKSVKGEFEEWRKLFGQQAE